MPPFDEAWLLALVAVFIKAASYLRRYVVPKESYWYSHTWPDIVR
jgi:hypothetical protein